jgi:alpha-galactosidase
MTAETVPRAGAAAAPRAVSLLALLLAAAAPAAAYDNGSPWPLPPLGWNTWCTDDYCGLLDLCFEQEVHDMADAMVSSGMVAAGYRLVELDDCWASTNRSASGDLQPDPARFPSGIPALAAYLEARGLVLGLYTSAGEKTCKYGRPGSAGHFAEDARWFARNNVKWVKADNCGVSGDSRTVFSNFSHWLNATGVPMAFSTCQWGEEAVWDWGASIAQAFRINQDHLPFWTFNTSGNGGQGTREIIEVMANPSIGGSTRRFGYADPDFLMTGIVSMSALESETEFAFWALFGGPMIVATDVRNMSAWKRSVLLNADVLGVSQDELVQPGRRVRGAAGGAQVWSKALANGDLAVILYNGADAPAPIDISLQWAELGWPAAAVVTARDLWAHAPVPGSPFSGGGATAAAVPPHGHAMWRLSKQ